MSVFEIKLFVFVQLNLNTEVYCTQLKLVKIRKINGMKIRFTYSAIMKVISENKIIYRPGFRFLEVFHAGNDFP